MRGEVQDAAMVPRLLPRVQLAAGLASLALFAALLFVPAVAPWLTRFEHWTADWRTAYLSPRASALHPRIVIAAITDETLKDLASSPIDRGLMSQLITAIDAAQPKAIGVDVFFLKRTDDAKDDALIAALASATAPLVLGAIDERGELEPTRWAFQSAYLGRTGHTAGYLNLRHEADGVVRYAARPHSGSVYPKSFARLLAEASGASAADTGAPVSWSLPSKAASVVFETIPAHDLISANGAAAASRLKDRIVLIGGDFSLPPRDRHRIPLSVRDGADSSGVAIHGHILAGMLDPASAVTELSPVAMRALLAGLGATGFLLGWSLWRSSLVGFLRWTFATGLLLAIDAACFTQFHLLLPFTLAFAAWVLGVTAGSALHAVAIVAAAPAQTPS